MNPKADWFFEKDSPWQEEFALLRKQILNCGLTEEIKWGHPCYNYRGSNVVLIHGFKDYCALLFHKGALLKDTEHLLIQQTKNVQAARQLRFTGSSEIRDLEPTIRAYVYEAIEVEKAGLEVKKKKTAEFDVPEELTLEFRKDPDFETAFKSLTPGRQRGYLLYFSGAKQAKTREARIEKYRQAIFEGKGLND